MKIMQIKYDVKADALYIKLKKAKVVSTKERKNYLVDYDKNGAVIGFEVLNCLKKIPLRERKELFLASR
jgi:uncharacterized protein YuzE